MQLKLRVGRERRLKCGKGGEVWWLLRTGPGDGIGLTNSQGESDTKTERPEWVLTMLVPVSWEVAAKRVGAESRP